MTYDSVHHNPEVAKRLGAIYALHRKDNDFRLERSPYNELLSALGDPHLSLPPTIHLAGTNGKGSTLAFLKSIYEAAGYKVHAFTSPHLLTFNERVTLAGKQISDDQLLAYLDEIDVANGGRAVTFFEYTTALAFKAMADTQADICLLETGLGGRLDCTNIIENPIATVMTSIGYDHMDFLGDRIEDIAGEKAGIIKSGAPCIAAPQRHDAVNAVFKAKTDDIYHVKMPDDLPPLGLVGAHQAENASTALKTVEILQSQFPVSDNEVKNGLQNARWAGRMEKITRGAVYDAIPDGAELWFDCGHNAEGAQAIGTQLKTWKDENPTCQIHMILGLASDKDPNRFLEPLMNHIDSLTCVDLQSARNPQSGGDLASKIDKNESVIVKITLQKAIQNIKDKNTIIFVAGSVYLYRDLVT